MSKILSLVLLFTLIANSTIFATETTTDCPMMRESNQRTNPKLGLDAKKSKKSKDTSAIKI